MFGGLLISVFKKVLNSDSRRIGFLYLGSCAAFLLVGITCAVAIQFEMSKLTTKFLNPEQYGQAVTQHGLAMVFVFLLPLLSGTLGNLVLPAALGTKNLALPKLNLVGWFLHVIGGILTIVSVELGSYTMGWTMLMPPAAPKHLFILLIAGLALCAGSVLIQALCTARSICSPRHRAMGMKQLPLFAWFFLFWAVLNILLAPIRLLTLALTAVALNNPSSYLSLSDPAGIVRYQQLFWLYAGPVLLAVLLPAIGISFEVLSAHTRASIPSRTKFVLIGIGLSLLILLSWGQNLVTAADQEKLAAIGSLFAALTTVPILLVMATWLRMLVAASKNLTVPIAFVWIQIASMAVIWLTTLALAIPALRMYLHNSYFTVAQLHLLLVGFALTSFLAGLFHWLPTVMNREYSHWLAYVVAVGMLLGLMATFGPQFILGMQGSPKGLYTYPEQYHTLHLLSSIGAVVLAASLLLGLAVTVWSCFRGVFCLDLERQDASGGEFSYRQMAADHAARTGA